MDKGKERRKFERYAKSLPVRLSDSVRTKGKMLNLSREGCLLVLEDGTIRPKDSLIKFRVYLNGIVPPEQEKTTPEISIQGIFAPSKVEAKEADKNPFCVKIIAKIVRYDQQKGLQAMGIQFLELGGHDLSRWLDFIWEIKKEFEALPFGTKLPNKSDTNVDPNKPSYTVRFKSVKSVQTYFPAKIEKDFFVPTKTEIKKNTKIDISFFHPETKELLQIEAIVTSSGFHPLQKQLHGIFCRHAEHGLELIHKLNNFIGDARY